ncbi:hypothetical protein [Microseira wollei]|uniref:Uncharacterized protein n=1 Tax=Microseira wollei NIES-4236 TaxID=2530354 RepID=A0AAV3XUR9_9CYAN|nr:hypothetical protein [Microseira wollei]GET44682.1 hypothetical protein MiSe_95150 [Microseira wollei NIES-4236]
MMKNLQIAVSRPCKISPLLIDKNPATIVMEAILYLAGTRHSKFYRMTETYQMPCPYIVKSLVY